MFGRVDGTKKQRTHENKNSRADEGVEQQGEDAGQDVVEQPGEDAGQVVMHDGMQEGEDGPKIVLDGPPDLSLSQIEMFVNGDESNTEETLNKNTSMIP